MAENPHEDLSAEISRLWGKLASPAAESAIEVEAAYTASSAAWDTVALLKKRHAREARRWAELLEAKEGALKALEARRAAMEDELSLLRSQAGRAEERALTEAAEVEVKLAEALRALTEERDSRRREREALEAALESGREKTESETRRARSAQAGLAERLRKLEAERAEFQTLAAGREFELVRAQAALKEAKQALERTLAELLFTQRGRPEPPR